MGNLYIAAADESGRSYVESTTAMDPDFHVLWHGDFPDIHDVIEGLDPASARIDVEPPAGGVRWAVLSMPPTPEAGDMHYTRTLDFDYVVSGRMDCVLDTETVELVAGDAILIKAANHAWHSRSTEPAVMAFLLLTPIRP